MATTLTIKHHLYVDGDDDDAILSRAGHRVDVGDVRGAITELEKLSAGPRVLCKEWLYHARCRCVLEASLSTMQADMTVLSRGL
jgi:hypothetical protein